MKKPIKNYIYLFLILTVSLISSIYLVDSYENNLKKEEEKTLIETKLRSVLIDELDNFIKERSEVTILVLDTTKASEKFMKTFIDNASSFEFSDKVVFIDSKDFTEKDYAKLEKYNEYNKLINIMDKKYYSILYFEENLIKDSINDSLLNPNKKLYLKFLVDNEVIEYGD